MANNVNGSLLLPETPDPDTALSSVHNVSYAQALQRGKPNVPTSTPNNNLVEDPNLNNETSIYDSEPSMADANDTLDELRVSDESETLDCHVSDGSDIIEEFNTCLDNDVVSEITLDPRETTDELSTPSEITENQEVSEVHQLSSDPTKTSLSSSNNVNKTTGESGGYSSDLSSEDATSCEDEEGSEETVDVNDLYPSALKWQLRATKLDLPETVTLLDVPGGGKVYLVGTAHFSLESQEDVAKIIRSTHPDVVMVELCKSRINILSLDEATILEESKNMNLAKIQAAIRQNGFMQGVLYLLLLNMSAHLTKQLGMAPGGEFRTAFSEAKKIPGCVIHLGDRPIHITLQRALATLSLWQKMRMAWYMLTSREPISKQEVERCKQRDLLEETLAEMTGEFPELSKVFVEERDTFLVYSLQMASTPMPSHVSPSGVNSTVVVGVVGIGHVPGIVAKWGKVTEKDIPPIINIPEQSTSSKVIRKALRYSVYGLILYCGYRIIPKQLVNKPVSFIQRWLRSSLMDLHVNF